MSVSPSSLHTEHLHCLLERMAQGDSSAVDELLRLTAVRLELLARRMLHTFPDVRAREQTADIVQEASLRLLAALREFRPDSMRAFYALANQHIRFALLDLARRHRRGKSIPLGAIEEPVAPEETDLPRWQALHEAAEALPADLREVFSLRFYHGGTWDEIGEMLQISPSTARRHWLSAGVLLEERLRGELPS